MARYEIHDEDAQSFWEITLAGKTFTLRWGRVRSRGQGQVKHFASEAEARREYDKLVAAKRKRGYRLVPGTEEPEVRRTGTVEHRAPAPRNPELEAAVIADPSDEAALMVLGDWLQAQGDPRGELISLGRAQKQAGDPMRFLALKREVEAHYAAHEAELLGDSYPWRHLFKLDWQLGYVRGAKLSLAARRPDDPQLAALLAKIVELPSAVALQELGLGSLGAPDPAAGRYRAAIDQLASSGQPRALRSLHLGDYWPGTREPGYGQLGDLSGLAAFPKLRRLVLASGSSVFGSLALPELRSLDHRADADAAAIAWICAAPWPQLETLSLTLHTYVDFWGVLRTTFPRLRQLRLIDTQGTDALCDALPNAPLLPQLELLDLDDGDLSDDGAARLIDHWGAFRHLKVLRLGKQHVTYGACKRLRALGIDVLEPKAYR